MKRHDIVIVLDRLRSAHNVGNIFRLAEAVGAEIVGCGYTALPPHPKLEKTAMGTDKTVRFRHCSTSMEAVTQLRDAGYMIVAAEPGDGATCVWSGEFREPVAIVLGNEALGIESATLDLVDCRVELPMIGQKASINVSNAAAAMVYAVLEKLEQNSYEN